MAGCKDIIVNIKDYNPADVYTVVVRVKGSVATDAILPTYTKTVTGSAGPQVKFTGLPEGDYEVGIRRTCALGGQSNWVWIDVVATGCLAPTGLEIDADSVSDGITETTADLRWDPDATATFEYKVDVSEWAEAGTEDEQLSGLLEGHVYTFFLRKVCGIYTKSLPVSLSFATDISPDVPTFKVRILEKVCNGSEFVGYRLRFSFTGGLATVGEFYRIKFTDYYGNETTVIDREVENGETLEDVMKDIAASFNPVNMIIGSDFAAFDIIAKEQKISTGLSISCQDVDSTTGFAVDIH